MRISRRDWCRRTAALAIGGAALPSLVSGDEKVLTTHELIRKLADDAPLSMQFDGKTSDECRKWQYTFSAQLRKCLGAHRPPSKWQTIVESVDELEDHVRHRLVLAAEGHPLLPGLFASAKR